MPEIRSPLSASAPLLDPFAPVRLSPVSVNGSAVPHAGVEMQGDDGSWECVAMYRLKMNA